MREKERKREKKREKERGRERKREKGEKRHVYVFQPLLHNNSSNHQKSSRKENFLSTYETIPEEKSFKPKNIT